MKDVYARTHLGMAKVEYFIQPAELREDRRCMNCGSSPAAIYQLKDGRHLSACDPCMDSGFGDYIDQNTDLSLLERCTEDDFSKAKKEQRKTR